MNRRRNYYERESKVPIFIAGAVVIVIIIGLFVLLFNGERKYKEYNSYDENTKQYGTVEHYEKENDHFYVSFYYPKLKEKNLNKIIKESNNSYLKSQRKKKDQKDILYLDYSCKKIYKQYIVVKLDYKRVSENKKKTDQLKYIMTYDCKTNQLLTLKDCLHANMVIY